MGKLIQLGTAKCVHCEEEVLASAIKDGLCPADQKIMERKEIDHYMGQHDRFDSDCPLCVGGYLFG